MNDCPKCRERDQKAASSCESKYKDLESKYQKLVIVVAIISGIVGKEIVEEAMSIFDKAKPAITVSEIPKVTTAEIISPRYYPRDNSVLFADLPPILPSLGNHGMFDFEADLFSPNQDPIFVPEIGAIPALVALPFLPNRRKRQR